MNIDNIELVIKIPEEAYKLLKNEGVDWLGAEHILNAVANGTPLPKGHGELKDVTNLMRGLYTDMKTIEETFMSSDVYKMINEECPTIIEADNAESEDKE